MEEKKKRFFGIGEKTVETPSNEKFYLHMHNHYEIYMFLEGDAKYVVEENVYDLKPYDVIIIRRNQLHRVYHNTSAKYRRIVLKVTPKFFETNDCECYEKQFMYISKDIGNKLDSEIVHSSGLYDAFMRVRKYSEDYSKLDSPIACAGIVEILYLLNSINDFSAPATSDSLQLKTVIEYLNENFTKNITLSALEKKFFISKYHLCHIFPQATGLTVHQYITKKRLAFVREMIKEGKNIGDAAHEAGFNNYSSFYRAYTNEYGTAPQQNRKNHN